MTVWSSEIKELEKLHESLKGQSPELEKELGQLIKFEDPNVIMLYSRRCLEVIITDLCECELKRSRKTEPLKGIIDKLLHEGKVPSHIITSMDSLNSLSTYGTHPKDFDPEQVKPVLSNLAIIIKWYLKYKETKKVIQGKPEGLKSEDKIPESIPVETTGSKKKWIILVSGLILFLAVIVAGLFIFNIIGGKKQAKALEKSIAVLPFINDSQDEENTYFINGIMDEVLNNLQKIKDLSVVSRTSVEQFRSQDRPAIPEIARKLDVNFIVEGSGQKYGNTFRLRVQLIDGTKDKHLWAQSYEKEIKKPEDIFNIQSQIAQSIAEELKAIITPEEKQIIEKTLTSNLTAYDFYLRGKEELTRYRTDNRNIEALTNAEKFYHLALSNDSTYAQAFAGLAMVYWDKHYQDTYFATNFLDSVPILANIAISYDDQTAEAYSLKGDFYREKGEYSQASDEYEKALKINPNYWQAYAGQAVMYGTYSRNAAKTFENMYMALKLNHDPLLLPSFLGTVGSYNGACGFFDEERYYYNEKLKLDGDSADYYSSLAFLECRQSNNYLRSIEYLEHSYALDSNNFRCLSDLGFYNDLIGKHIIALTYYKRYIAKCDEAKVPWINYVHRFGYCYWENGFKKEGEYYLNLQKKYCEDAIKLNRQYAQFGGAYFDLAAVYAFLGEKEKAFENLSLYNKVIGDYENLVMLWYFKNDPLLESIRNEPRFQSILHELEIKEDRTRQEIMKLKEEQGKY
jgi:TolB-like protein